MCAGISDHENQSQPASRQSVDYDEVFVRDSGVHTLPLREQKRPNTNKPAAGEEKPAACHIRKRWSRDYFSSCKTGYQEHAGDYSPAPSPHSAPPSPLGGLHGYGYWGHSDRLYGHARADWPTFPQLYHGSYGSGRNSSQVFAAF